MEAPLPHTHLKHDVNLVSQWVCVNQCNLQRYSVGIEERAGLDSREGNKAAPSYKSTTSASGFWFDLLLQHGNKEGPL